MSVRRRLDRMETELLGTCKRGCVKCLIAVMGASPVPCDRQPTGLAEILTQIGRAPVTNLEGNT